MKRLLVGMVMVCAIWGMVCYAAPSGSKGIEGVEHFSAKTGIPTEYTPEEGSIEELYKDMLVTQLQPIISKGIEQYYGNALMYDLFDIRFMEVKREAYRGFNFLVTVRVEPFVGAHNAIGQDELVIRMQPGEAKLEHFKHIKSYPVPDYRP
ncbi:MAG: DUF3888 domain-containing protein [Cellulosilyticaceae bacterium]